MLILLLILMAIVPISASAVIWGDELSADLLWGDGMSLGDYEIVLSDFSTERSSKERVLLEICESGAPAASQALRAGESVSLNDSLLVTVERITVEDLQKEPSARVNMQLAAVPETSMTLVSDKELYRGGEEIRLDLSARNDCEVDSEDITINITSDPPLLSAKFSRSELKAGEAWEDDEGDWKEGATHLKVKAPYLPAPADIQAVAEASYLDPRGKLHRSWAVAAFRIAGPLKVHKTVEEVQEFGKEYAVVNSVVNQGDRILEIEMKDATGREFAADQSLSWDLRVPPGESRAVSYKIEAKRPGKGLVLPGCEVGYSWVGDEYKVNSESHLVDVFGPFVELDRSAKPRRVEVGDDLILTTRLDNAGNRKALVRLGQPIPAGLNVVEGHLNCSALIRPGENLTLECKLRALRPGDLRIPPADISFRGVRGELESVKGSAITVAAYVEVDEEQEENSSMVESNVPEAVEELPDEEEQAFDLLVPMALAVVMLLFAVFNRYP